MVTLILQKCQQKASVEVGVTGWHRLQASHGSLGSLHYREAMDTPDDMIFQATCIFYILGDMYNLFLQQPRKPNFPSTMDILGLT